MSTTKSSLTFLTGMGIQQLLPVIAIDALHVEPFLQHSEQRLHGGFNRQSSPGIIYSA